MQNRNFEDVGRLSQVNVKKVHYYVDKENVVNSTTVQISGRYEFHVDSTIDIHGTSEIYSFILGDAYDYFVEETFVGFKRTIDLHGGEIQKDPEIADTAHYDAIYSIISDDEVNDWRVFPAGYVYKLNQKAQLFASVLTNDNLKFLN